MTLVLGNPEPRYRWVSAVRGPLTVQAGAPGGGPGGTGPVGPPGPPGVGLPGPAGVGIEDIADAEGVAGLIDVHGEAIYVVDETAAPIKSTATAISRGLTKGTAEIDGGGFIDAHDAIIPSLQWGPDGWLTDEAVGNIAARLRWSPPAKISRPLPPDVQADLEARLVTVVNAEMGVLDARYPGTGTITSFGYTAATRDEDRYRPPTSAAYGAASAVRHGLVTGTARTALLAKVIRYAGSYALGHKGTNPDGWGGISPYPGQDYLTYPGGQSAQDMDWQGTLYASQAAQALWWVWDEVPADVKAAALAMVEYEADRFAGYTPPVFATLDSIRTWDNSRCEENAWDATALASAVLMHGPTHPRAEQWMDMLWTLAGCSYNTRADVALHRELNGFDLGTLPGWQVLPDGTVRNHGTVHPNYMAAGNSLWCGVATGFATNGLPIPEIAMHGAATIYDALQDRGLYRPDGTVEGFAYADKVSVDVTAWCYGYDRFDTTGADWAAMHLAQSIARNERDHWACMNLGWAVAIAHAAKNYTYFSNASTRDYLRMMGA